MDIYRAKEVLKLIKEFDNIKGTASRVAIDIALAALEYQIPKKPLSNGHEEYELNCCDNCCQKLDWK